jgi:hypothetical protein
LGRLITAPAKRLAHRHPPPLPHTHSAPRAVQGGGRSLHVTVSWPPAVARAAKGE